MLDIPTIRAIAFDWGGIFTRGTFDSSSVSSFAKHWNVSEERIAETYFPLMASFEVGAFDLPTFHKKFEEASGLQTPFDTFRETFLGAVREREEMFEVLGSIPESYRVGMMSNNVPVLCDTVRDDPRMSRVDAFVFSNEIHIRKPDPKAFRALSDALGVPPEETVFIDDSVANIEACRALGYHGILLETLSGFVSGWQEVLPDLPLNVVEG